MNNYWTSTKETVFKELETTQEGLSDSEVAKRLEKYGENKLLEEKRKSIARVFVEQFADVLVAILVIAAVISAITGGIESAIVIIAVLILNAILGTVQHFKAEKSLSSLKAMSAPNANVIRNGNKIKIEAKNIVVGDILLLEAGDVASADARIIENYSLQVNESALTGESENVNKTSDIIEQEELALGDRKNMIYSGSLVSYGRCEAVVTGTGMNTEIGKIAHLMQSAKEKVTPLQISLDNFSKKLSILIIGISIVVFLLGVFRGENITDSLMFAVALAVAAIPEALSSIVTIGLAFGTQKMAKENAIIKKLRAVESLGCVSVICSDKTGTLTQNKMTVQHMYTLEGDISADNVNVKAVPLSVLNRIAVLCNDGVISEGGAVGDPTETALLEFCIKSGDDEKAIREQYERIGELPFDSDRKLMSTLNKIDDKFMMMTKGAVDVMLSRCNKALIYGKVETLNNEMKKAIEEQNRLFSMQGLRVLAFAQKPLEAEKSLVLEDENDLIFVGLISMMDPPREESAQAVEDCKRAGIKAVMITGDHKITATAIAKKIGIMNDGDKAVEGVDVEAMSDEELKKEVNNISVYARVSPEHKIRIVKAWQENGRITAMTGDGVNDAPALKQADIGVAMGITGTEVSKDASAMILTDDNFSTIVKAVANGRNVYTNIKHSIQFLLSGNFAAIFVVIITSVFALPLPFTAVQLLFINLLTDSLPALAVNMEKPTGDLLNQKPRSATEHILTNDFMKIILTQSGLIAIATLGAFFIGNYESPELACTMAFATLCLARLFHGFNCRGTKSVFRLPKNKYSVGAFLLGATLLMIVLFVQPLYSIFDIASIINGLYISEIVVLAFLPTFVIQIIRLFKERYKN